MTRRLPPLRHPQHPQHPGTHHPGTLALGDALGKSTPLARLLLLAQESRQRYDAISPLLPPALREAVRAGPLDDEGWSLLAAHGAAAAKLRQLLPLLQDALRTAGWQVTTIRVRVQPLQPP